METREAMRSRVEGDPLLGRQAVLCSLTSGTLTSHVIWIHLPLYLREDSWFSDPSFILHDLYWASSLDLDSANF